MPSYPFETHALQQFLAGSAVDLFHGTTRQRADVLLRDGKAGFAPIGANQGRSSLLYLTTHPENALLFSQQSGDAVVLRVTVPASSLRMDPEDGVYQTVLEELQSAAASGVPASIAVQEQLLATAFSDVSAAVQEGDFAGHGSGSGESTDVLTESNAFKAWFGGSKLVDAQGAPLLVYHGSVSREINVFDISTPPVRPRSGPDGVYFTSDHRTASGYTRRPGESVRVQRGKVISAYLRLLNPLDITPELKKFQRKGLTFAQAKAKSLEGLDRDKHDGVVFRGNAQNTDEYIVFHVSQIKSAEHNTGRFDLSDDDIRFSEIDELTAQSVYSYSGKHRELAIAIRGGDVGAIAQAGSEMAAWVKPGDVIVPMPGRTGDANVTLELAHAIAAASGARVADILKGKERESVYDAKKAGRGTAGVDLTMSVNKTLGVEVANVIVIDNVIATGATAQAAVDALQSAGLKARILTYAGDEAIAHADSARHVHLEILRPPGSIPEKSLATERCSSSPGLDLTR